MKPESSFPKWLKARWHSVEPIVNHSFELLTVLLAFYLIGKVIDATIDAAYLTAFHKLEFAFLGSLFLLFAFDTIAVLAVRRIRSIQEELIPVQHNHSAVAQLEATTQGAVGQHGTGTLSSAVMQTPDLSHYQQEAQVQNLTTGSNP